MKKYGLLSMFSVITVIGLLIFSLTSCNRNEARHYRHNAKNERYEMADGYNLHYNIGENFNHMRFNNLRFNRHYNGKVEEVRSNDNVHHHFDFNNGMLNFRHDNYNVRYDLKNVKGFNHISTSEELKALENQSGIYVLESGTYDVDALNFQNEIALIGRGKVRINVKNAHNDAAITFANNATLSNIKINVANNDIYALNVNTKGNSINRFYADNVKITGSRGILLNDVRNAHFNNSRIKLTDDINSSAFTVSNGTKATFTDSKITGGKLGSVRVLGNENSNAKNNVEFIRSTVNGNAYIEDYNSHKSEITGLDWIRTEGNNMVSYIRNAIQ